MAERVRPGVSRLTGAVHNESGTAATGVRLAIDILDGANQVLTRYVGWVPGELPGLSSRDFAPLEVPTANGYRLAVDAYALIESP